MIETLAFAAVVTMGAGLVRAVCIGLLAGEVKGAFASYLEARVRRAAAKLEPQFATDQEEEWLEEFAVLRDRPVRAFLFVRGLGRAARAMASDSTLSPVAAAEGDAIELIGRGYHQVIELIGRRWTGAIVGVLIEQGTLRFGEIADAVPELSDRLLSERMKELESRGIVVRTVRPGQPVRVEYELTEMGRELEPTVRELDRWAKRWLG
jgi:DNA-binding HxlR family transcriptional regulator